MSGRRVAILFAAFFFSVLMTQPGKAQQSPPETQSPPPAGQITAPQLSPEELGDVFMARKDFKEATVAY